MSASWATELDRQGPVSPELALVDPALRRRLLQGLAQERLGPAARSGPSPSPVAQFPDHAAQADARSEPGKVRPPEPRVGLVVVVIASVVAFVLGAKFAGSPELSPAQVGAAYAAQLPAAPRPSHVLSPGLQRLAWAPVAGADGYEVAIYHGGRRVYDVRTAVPTLELSSSVWRDLPRGVLAWYVWPTRNGVRDASPVVRSLLSSFPTELGR